MIPIDGSRLSTDAAPASTDVASTDPDIAPVSQLLERRDQVQGWLGRLDELAHECAAHIAARVRADYEDRLASFLAELASHLDSLRADVQRLRADFDAANTRHVNAADSLEEVRLRYRIGEVEEERWEERRAVLEEEVATAATARDSVASELERLEALVTQIEGSTAAPRHLLPEIAISRAGASDLPETPAEDEDGDDVIDIAELAAAVPASDEETVPEPGALLAELEYPWEIALHAERGDEPDADAESDLPASDFLEELDRALNDETAEDPAFTLTEAELDTRPKPGVKCPDCGYTNDPQAWYCGVCGADLN